MKEDLTPYQPQTAKKERAQPLNDPDCIGAEAALARASAKAVARDRAAGLEPVARSREEAHAHKQGL